MFIHSLIHAHYTLSLIHAHYTLSHCHSYSVPSVSDCTRRATPLAFHSGVCVYNQPYPSWPHWVCMEDKCFKPLHHRIAQHLSLHLNNVHTHDSPNSWQILLPCSLWWYNSWSGWYSNSSARYNSLLYMTSHKPASINKASCVPWSLLFFLHGRAIPRHLNLDHPMDSTCSWWGLILAEPYLVQWVTLHRI